MHLRRLILKGFKSFADRTVVALEPGVTVIVGPNGSGKSNITDAVLWVLGEQSAKSLRGTAMEDVIFAGSSARQAVGVAEVDLVLDNADSTLPLEFSEVTITRRMFRSGESEYLVNQSPSRLMDVQELLHDSGLGRDTHSIISQGRLDEVLNSRPEDRRALIEEAAGVLKHKKRKERALRRLAGMDAYLERARDITSEIERQLRPLQRQATRAAEHADLTSELRDIDVALAVDELRGLQEAWDSVAKRENEADADVELSRYRLTEKQRELDKFQSLLEEKGLFVGDLSEQRRRMQTILGKLDAGLLLLEEKGKNLIERLSELRQKLYQSESRSAARSSELVRLTDERVTTDALIKALYGQLGELRRETEAVRKARTAADEELSRISTSIRRTRKQVEGERLELSTAEKALSASRLEEELLAERAEQVREQRQSAQATLSARRARIEQHETTLARTKREMALADSDVDKRVRVLDSRRKTLAERRDSLAAVRGEARGLEEVDRAFATSSPALAWALAHEKELEGLIGTLSERIKTPSDLERLTERVLGADLFGILVSDEQALSRIAASIAQHAPGDIALIPIEGMRTRGGQKNRDTSGSVAERIECDEAARPVVDALLGDVFVADSLEEALGRAAREEPGRRYVTPEGTILWPSGKVTVGAVVDDTPGVLARKRRINELGDEVAALTARVGEAEAATAGAEEALSAAQQDALDVSQKLAALAGGGDSLREEVGRLEQLVTTLDAEADRVAHRIVEIHERTAKDSPQTKTLAEKIRDAEAEIEALEDDSAKARQARDARFREEAATNERLSACQIEIAAVSEREVHLKRQLTSIRSELAELEETVRASRETADALELLRDRIEPVHDMYTALKERAEHWAERLRDRARFEAADSESLRSTIHAAQEAARDAQAEVDLKLASAGDVRVEKGQLEIQVNTAVRRIVEELGVPVERALESAPIEDRESTLERAHRLRKRLANLGPVNPIAKEEYDALASRREFMLEQLEDLEASRKALHKILAAIDRKIRERFLETFEHVDAYFQETFALLFPGGTAQLSLTEPDDPETTGVEVVAQPRGKKLSKLSLMSGGEKSLTALALLFAVYRTRPCPFYILDEVEAALDDVNLRRFIAFVDSMRSETQFIIITHQRRTMEMADVLYGVSMQADGVTKMVSERLERAAKNAEEADEHAVV